MNIFEEFDKKFSLEGLKKDVEDAKENGANFKEVPFGKYEVKIEKMELIESKTHKPMVSVWFKILEGEFKGSLIFMNQLIDEGFKINMMNEFLKTLESEMDIYFDSFTQYNNLILDVHESIDGKLEYLLEYAQNNKGYNTYKIKEVFSVE